MKEEKIKYYQEKTRGVFHILEYRRFWDYIANLQEELEVSQTNEETYRLEMQDITKCLGLKEDTIFDEVKEYATNLQEELKEYKMIFDTFSKRPYAHRYLEEKKKELGNNKIIGLDSEMIYKDYYNLKEENERLKKDLKTLWNVCWNNDTEMTSYQNEVFDNYYDVFHKNSGDEEC